MTGRLAARNAARSDWIVGMMAIPPQVNVIGSLMFFGALAIVIIAQNVGRARRKA